MNSGIMTAIGLGSVDPAIFLIIAYVLLIAAIVLLIVMIVKLNKLKERYEKFMLGSSAASLEDDIATLTENVNILIANDQTNADDIAKLFKKHRTTFQKMGMVKYDAFKEMGGKLSFSLVLLDENNDGVLLDSVQSSSGCYSYTKEIRAGKCDIELSPEEAEAVKIAVSGN